MDRAINVCPNNILEEITDIEKIFHNALLFYAKNKQENLHGIVKHANLSTYSELIESFAKEGNKEALNRLVSVCPNSLIEETFKKAIEMSTS